MKIFPNSTVLICVIEITNTPALNTKYYSKLIYDIFVLGHFYHKSTHFFGTLFPGLKVNWRTKMLNEKYPKLTSSWVKAVCVLCTIAQLS